MKSVGLLFEIVLLSKKTVDPLEEFGDMDSIVLSEYNFNLFFFKQNVILEVL